MSKTVTVTLTLAEAKAAVRAMGNSIDDDDAAMAILLNRQTVAAAGRAQDKICDEIRRASDGR